MAKYTKTILENAAKASTSIMGVLRFLGVSESSGGMHHHISRRMANLGIDTSHFTGTCWNKGKKGVGSDGVVRSWQEILVLRTEKHREKAEALRRALIESGRPEICTKCSLGTTWNGEPLRLQVDHIDGNNLDNRPENVRFLCPNCHTQTPTHGRRKQTKAT